MSDSNVAMLQHENDFDPGGPWVQNLHDFAWYFPYASLVHAHAFVTVTRLVISIKTALSLQLGRSATLVMRSRVSLMPRPIATLPVSSD